MMHNAMLSESNQALADLRARLTEAPSDMTTPQLVREFTSRKCADARGEACSAPQHIRHCAVVTELRLRHVLD